MAFPLTPGGPYKRDFPMANTAGVASFADTTPTISVSLTLPNGTTSTDTWAPSITTLAPGQYRLTGTLPATYIGGSLVEVWAAATMNGNACSDVVHSFQVQTITVGTDGGVTAGTLGATAQSEVASVIGTTPPAMNSNAPTLAQLAAFLGSLNTALYNPSLTAVISGMTGSATVGGVVYQAAAVNAAWDLYPCPPLANYPGATLRWSDTGNFSLYTVAIDIGSGQVQFYGIPGGPFNGVLYAGINTFSFPMNVTFANPFGSGNGTLVASMIGPIATVPSQAAILAALSQVPTTAPSNMATLSGQSSLAAAIAQIPTTAPNLSALATLTGQTTAASQLTAIAATMALESDLTTANSMLTAATTALTAIMTGSLTPSQVQVACANALTASTELATMASKVGTIPSNPLLTSDTRIPSTLIASEANATANRIAVLAAMPSSGGGAWPTTLAFTDSVSSQPIQGVNCTIFASGLVPAPFLTSGTAGTVTFNLNDGAYSYSTANPLYAGTSGTFSVSNATQAVPVSMVAVAITPSTVPFVTGYLTLYSMSPTGCVPAAGATCSLFTQTMPKNGTGIGIIGPPITATAGTNGVVQFVNVILPGSSVSLTLPDNNSFATNISAGATGAVALADVVTLVSS